MARLALTALLSLVAFAPAAGASHGACTPLVADKQGDAQGLPPALVPYAGGTGTGADPALDLVSADVASNAKRVTAVIRVRKLDEPHPDSSVGRIWRFYFTVPTNEQRFWLEVIQGANGVDAWVGRHNLPEEAGRDDMVAGRYAYVDARLDLDRGEIRVSAPLKVFERFARVRPGTLMYDVEVASFKHYGKASTNRDVAAVKLRWGPTGEEHVSDTARTERAYRAGSRACVTP